MKFSYFQYLTHPSPTTPTGILHRPEIPIRVAGKRGNALLRATVDPGSDDTLLPLSIGHSIGATMDSTQTWHVQGIGGQAISVILGEVEFELTDGHQSFRWSAKVGLVDFADPQDEVTILGHAGFLDYFRAAFDGHQRTLEIDITPAFPGQIM